jgi:hypothetical protein
MHDLAGTPAIWLASLRAIDDGFWRFRPGGQKFEAPLWLTATDGAFGEVAGRFGWGPEHSRRPRS